MSITKNDKKTIRAWCIYDWANSVYSLTITTAVFPSYFYGVTGDKGALVDFLGLQVSNSVLYSYTLSIAFLLVAIFNPLLSGIADFGGRKKSFMKFFSTLGALSCAGLYFFDASNISLGIILFGTAGVGFAGSLVFYNAYLPEITTEDQVDRVSAQGFSYGYVGSVLLLIINLVLILQNDVFGITKGEASRISFLMVGIWWFGFAQITFNGLPKDAKTKTGANLLSKGYNEFHKVWKQMKLLPITKSYLMAFFLYSMGVQTIMYMATIFGEEIVFSDLPKDERTPKLILLVLILQLVAIPGAYLFTLLSEKKGNIFSIGTSLIIWIGICTSAYFLFPGMHTAYYIVGMFVGLVMGGIQSMSRSTYSKFIPTNTKDHTSYFSFYETLEKTSIATGTFIFGLVLQLTQDMHYSALALSIFFIAGFLLIIRIPSKTKYDITIPE